MKKHKNPRPGYIYDQDYEKETWDVKHRLSPWAYVLIFILILAIAGAIEHV